MDSNEMVIRKFFQITNLISKRIESAILSWFTDYISLISCIPTLINLILRHQKRFLLGISC